MKTLNPAFLMRQVITLESPEHRTKVLLGFFLLDFNQQRLTIVFGHGKRQAFNHVFLSPNGFSTAQFDQQVSG